MRTRKSSYFGLLSLAEELRSFGQGDEERIVDVLVVSFLSLFQHLKHTWATRVRATPQKSSQTGNPFKCIHWRLLSRKASVKFTLCSMASTCWTSQWDSTSSWYWSEKTHYRIKQSRKVTQSFFKAFTGPKFNCCSFCLLFLSIYFSPWWISYIYIVWPAFALLLTQAKTILLLLYTVVNEKWKTFELWPG